MRKSQGIEKPTFLSLLPCDAECQEKKKEEERRRKAKEAEDEQLSQANKASREPAGKYDTSGQKIVEKSRRKEILEARRTPWQKVVLFMRRHRRYYLPPLIVIAVTIFVWLCLQIYWMRENVTIVRPPPR